MSKSKPTNQRGYLLISAIVLTVAMAAVAVTVTNMAMTSKSSTTDQYDQSRAYFLAFSGLERGIYALDSTDPTRQLACSNINFNNIMLESGKYFSVKGTLYSPSPTAYLSANISASNTVIPMTTTTGYSPNGGAITLDKEFIRYRGYSANANDCTPFNAPCLTGAVRGQNSTTAVTHNSGAAISQLQCDLVSTGSITGSTVQRKLIYQRGGLSKKGFAVGDSTGTALSLYTWNSAGNWALQSLSSSIPRNINLNDITWLSDGAAIAVGNWTTASGNPPLILYWDGSAWWQVLGITLNNSKQNLLAIDCPSPYLCMAVGTGGILWQSVWYLPMIWFEITDLFGGGWTEDLNGISCASENDCWAVGNNVGARNDPQRKYPRMIHWNGLLWSAGIYGSTQHGAALDGYAISCVAGNNCWAVADAGTVFHYDGSRWYETTSLGNGQPLYTIACVDANHCWTAGKQSKFYFYNGNSWSFFQSIASNIDIQRISCFSANDCWAVGTSGKFFHYNGSSWSETQDIGSVTMRSVSMTGGQNLSYSYWSG